MQTRPEMKNATEVAATVASSVNSPNQKGINMIDSKAVQVSSQPTFSFGDNKVRVMVRDGEPWFVASDVCDALEYSNSRSAVADHLDDDERMTVASADSHSGKRGGARLMTIISESGLYALVLRSRKPEARKFAKWVTSEVLPAIRKTGVYVGKPFTVNPGDVLTQEEQNTLRQMIEGMAKKLSADTKVQGRFIMQAWSKLKSHFKVSYREIPRLELTEAISIINRHTVEWELVDEAPKPSIATALAPEESNTKAAFDAATQAAASVQTAVFNAVLSGNDEWKYSRWLLAFVTDSKIAAPAIVQKLPHDAFATSWATLTRDIANGECLRSTPELLDMASACMHRLQQRSSSARLAA